MNENEQTNAGQPKQPAQPIHIGQTVQYTEKVGDKTRTYAATVTHVNIADQNGNQTASLQILQPEGGSRVAQNVAFSAEAKDGAFSPLPK